MGFFGDLLVAAGASLADAAVNSISNVQKASESCVSFVFNKKEKTGSESSEEFEKLLAKWDEIFQRENLIVDPKKSDVEMYISEAPYLCIDRYNVDLKKSKPTDSVPLDRYEDNNAILDILHCNLDEYDEITDETHGKISRSLIRYYPDKNDMGTYLVFSFCPQMVNGFFNLQKKERYISQYNTEFMYPMAGFLNLEFKSNGRGFHTEVMIDNPNSCFSFTSESNFGVNKGYEYINLKALFNTKGKSDVYEHFCNFVRHPYSLSEAEIARREAEEERKRLEQERKEREEEEREMKRKQKEEERLAEIERQKQIEEERKKAEREATASLLDSL